MSAQDLQQLFIFLLLFRTADSENSCLYNKTRSATFVYFDLKLTGRNPGASDFSMEALNCLANDQCTALVCTSPKTKCKPCPGDQITSISFSPGTYLTRKVIRLNIDTDPLLNSIDEFIPTPDGLKAGDLDYIKATHLKYDNYQLSFLINDSIIFYFRARCGDHCSNNFDCTSNQCNTDRYVKINSCVNGNWQDGTQIVDTNYPYAKNQQSELHVLLLSKSVQVYINRALRYTYTTPSSLSIKNVDVITVRGTIKIHEQRVY